MNPNLSVRVAPHNRNKAPPARTELLKIFLMETQTFFSEEKKRISLGVMLRRVAEGKMPFDAALKTPFSNYFAAISALNIPVLAEQNCFLLFLSKVVRTSLPLQAEKFVPIFYKMGKLYHNLACSEYFRLKIETQNLPLLQRYQYEYPAYSRIFAHLNYFSKHYNTPKNEKTWVFILRTALNYQLNAEKWWAYMQYLCVGRSIDVLPENVLSLLPENQKNRYFNRLITFFMTHYSGNFFPFEELEKLMLNRQFALNFTYLHQKMGGKKVEKALKFVPKFSLTTDIFAYNHAGSMLSLAKGKSVLALKNTPMKLNARMAHLFTQAPQGYNFEQAFRYAYVKAIGISEQVTNLFVRSLSVPRTQKLWGDLLLIIKQKEKFVNLSMQELAQINPMIDYINWEYHRNQDYSLKGRTWNSLMRNMEVWHYNRRNPYIDYKWKRSRWQEWEITQNGFVFRILELLSGRELIEESAKMGHCVHSYAPKCVRKESYIFSLRKYEIREEKAVEVERMATIEVQNNLIVQVRKHQNAYPNELDKQLLTCWIQQNKGLGYYGY